MVQQVDLILSVCYFHEKNIQLGKFIIVLNTIIVVISGLFFYWDIVLNSLLSIYVTGKVINAIHTKHRKITLIIVISHVEKMKETLLSNFVRGATNGIFLLVIV